MERSAHSPTRQVAAALGVALAALCLGCAAVEHTLQAGDYAGEPLSPESGRGAQRFQAELAIDATLEKYVALHGRPDYFYIVDRQKLYLFYVETDRAAMFERVLVEGSQVTELGRIPGHLMRLLPPDTKTRLEAKRAGAQRQAQAKARSQKRENERKTSGVVPAAQAPGGTYIGGFDVEEIVARMRPPLTAADPGVATWQRANARGGATVYNARVGATHYEVTLERVAFTVRVSASRKNLPPSAALAMQRVNGAVFGAKADAVTRRMLKLAKRAVADRSGRSGFHERVAGRTIRIGRRVDLGVLAYSVHP